MTDTTADTDKKESAGSLLKENSLKAAGYAYLMADAALFAANLMEGDRAGAKGAVMWGTGSVVLSLFANPKAEKQLQLLEHRLGDYLKKQGVEIPKNPTTAELTKEGGVIDHIAKFLYTYPSQVLNTVYAIGGASIAQGGFQQGMKSDLTKGSLVTAGGLAGLLIPEKKPDPQHPPQGAVGKAWSWIQEKPLRVSGAFYHLNNVFAATGVVEKWKQNKRNNVTGPARYSPYLRFLNVAGFVFANTMLAMSSKGHGGGSKTDDEVTAKLAEESAGIIAAQPKEAQEALVQNIAGYLSAQPEIGKTASQIADLLHQKLASVRQPAPSYAAHWQSRIQPPADSALSPTL